jgi:hypothetical protein
MVFRGSWREKFRGFSREFHLCFVALKVAKVLEGKRGGNIRGKQKGAENTSAEVVN